VSDRLSAVAAKLDAQRCQDQRPSPRAADPELDQFMVRPPSYSLLSTDSFFSCDTSIHVLICSPHASMRLLVIAGGLLQHAGEVPRRASAADPRSGGVLQERGEAARFDHR
jgi:hypothetical protein